jgi:hypothetical protein
LQGLHLSRAAIVNQTGCWWVTPASGEHFWTTTRRTCTTAPRHRAKKVTSLSFFATKITDP